MKRQMILHFFILFLCGNAEAKNPPHIIFIYADDLGWNDVSFHGSPQIPTPNIDALAMNGILLNNYYTEWTCTPSRGALMSGQYSIRVGLQHYIINAGEQSALPIEIVILPQRLKERGYSTHMIGKWHIGYMNRYYTPLYRGFDTFLGYHNGNIDYYSHAKWENKTENFLGVDWYNGTQLVTDQKQEYVTDTFAKESRRIIMNHDTSKPLFMYLSHLAVHTGNKNEPQQAPSDRVQRFSYISPGGRRVHAAKMSILDDAVGVTFKALADRGMLENSIVLFVSDNGGDVDNGNGAFASNHPLRGSKSTLWEGGVKVPALVWSPLLNLNKSRISQQMMHVVDWLPTLYSIAGGNVSDLGEIDGMNMWNALVEDLPSPRKNFLYNIDPLYGVSAYREGDMKVINGTAVNFNSWYPGNGYKNIGRLSSFKDWVFKNGSVVQKVLVEKGLWKNGNPDDWYNRSKVVCEVPRPESSKDCDPVIKPCLFNVTDDPCEFHDLADKFPEVVSKLMDSIDVYAREMVYPQFKTPDSRAQPLCHGSAHVPWLDPEHYHECNIA